MRLLNSGTVVQNETALYIARIRVRSTGALYTSANVSTLHYYVKNLVTGTVEKNMVSLSVGDGSTGNVRDTLVKNSDNPVVPDDTGVNFFVFIPGDAWPTANNKHRFEFYITPSGGSRYRADAYDLRVLDRQGG